MRGTVDFKELVDFSNKMQRLDKVNLELFIEGVAKELAARLLRQVIPATPVGQYPKSSGKVGGTLRAGWTSKTEKQAMSFAGADVASYVASLPIRRVDGGYMITIINPVHYASYVENGHWTKNRSMFIKGRYMLRDAEAVVESRAAAVIKRHLTNALKGTLV